MPSAVLRLTLAALLFFVVAAARGASNGNVSVVAGLTDSSVEVGDPVEFRINVVNGRADTPPRAPVVDGLNIAFSGSTRSSQFNWTNGVTTTVTTTTYVYSVEANKPGRYIIPGQDILVEGASFRTLPVTLTVLGNGSAGGPGQAAQAFVELVIPKKSAYVGESIPIEMRACYAPNVRRNPDPDPILSGDGFSVQKFASPHVGAQNVQGERYNVDIYKSAIAGLKLGSLTIGPVTIEPLVQLPRTGPRRRQYNDPFDSLFGDAYDPFNMAPPKRVKLESKPVEIEIRPLPEAGKPADFSGAIGQFRLEAEAVPRHAQTGEPVTVRLRLIGQGNFERVAPPVLTDDAGLKTYPTTSRFKADDEVNLSGIKTFEQVLIAQGPRTTLPPYHFNYLDPATGRYVTIDTPPLAVKIEGNELATPTPAPTAAVAAATPTPTPTPAPRRAPEDILYIRADPGPRRDATAFLPVYRRPVFWAVNGGVLAGLAALGAAAGMRARRLDAANQQAARLARQQGDLQRTLRQEDTGRREFYNAAARLAQLRAASATGRPDASLSAADICRVRGLDAQTAGSVQQIFDRHEELAYSGGPAAQTPVPPEERKGVLAVLDTLGRH